MTLLKTARHVGLKPKNATKRQKYILQPPGPTRSASLSRQDGLRDLDDISVDDVPLKNPTGVIIIFYYFSLVFLSCFWK